MTESDEPDADERPEPHAEPDHRGPFLARLLMAAAAAVMVAAGVILRCS